MTLRFLLGVAECGAFPGLDHMRAACYAQLLTVPISAISHNASTDSTIISKLVQDHQ